jgi:hypothetical protein
MVGGWVQIGGGLILSPFCPWPRWTLYLLSLERRWQLSRMQMTGTCANVYLWCSSHIMSLRCSFFFMLVVSMRNMHSWDIADWLHTCKVVLLLPLPLTWLLPFADCTHIQATGKQLYTCTVCIQGHWTVWLATEQAKQPYSRDLQGHLWQNRYRGRVYTLYCGYLCKLDQWLRQLPLYKLTQPANLCTTCMLDWLTEVCMLANAELTQ